MTMPRKVNRVEIVWRMSQKQVHHPGKSESTVSDDVRFPKNPFPDEFKDVIDNNEMTSEILEHLLDIRLDKTVPFQEVLDKRLPFQELLQHPQVPEEVLPAGPRDDRPDQQDRAPSRRHVPYETAKEKKLEKYASVA
ncbi:hypothetical protein J6590_003105 [Homalodisca vitripennis]|nr:hypothetical protein J6590_003105 [Homalodisca vitripennis]